MASPLSCPRKVLPVSNRVPLGVTPVGSILRVQNTPRRQSPPDLPAGLNIPLHQQPRLVAVWGPDNQVPAWWGRRAVRVRARGHNAEGRGVGASQ